MQESIPNKINNIYSLSWIGFLLPLYRLLSNQQIQHQFLYFLYYYFFSKLTTHTYIYDL